MSQGKYSPSLTRDHCNRPWSAYVYNADRGVAPDYVKGEVFDPRLHTGSYDEEGYDRYGYSAFLSDGTFVGEGYGIDRFGYTEDEYSNMTIEQFQWI